MKKITTVVGFLLIGYLYSADDKGQPANLITDKIVQLPSGGVLKKRFTDLIQVGDQPSVLLRIASDKLTENMLTFVPHPRPVHVRLADVLAYKKISVGKVYDLIGQSLDISLELEDCSAEEKQAFRILVLGQVYKNKNSVLDELESAGLLSVED